jgi:hypothetical protein
MDLRPWYIFRRPRARPLLALALGGDTRHHSRFRLPGRIWPLVGAIFAAVNTWLFLSK